MEGSWRRPDTCWLSGTFSSKCCVFSKFDTRGKSLLPTIVFFAFFLAGGGKDGGVSFATDADAAVTAGFDAAENGV